MWNWKDSEKWGESLSFVFAGAAIMKGDVSPQSVFSDRLSKGQQISEGCDLPCESIFRLFGAGYKQKLMLFYNEGVWDPVWSRCCFPGILNEIF